MEIYKVYVINSLGNIIDYIYDNEEQARQKCSELANAQEYLSRIELHKMEVVDGLFTKTETLLKYEEKRLLCYVYMQQNDENPDWLNEVTIDANNMVRYYGDDNLGESWRWTNFHSLEEAKNFVENQLHGKLIKQYV